MKKFLVLFIGAMFSFALKSEAKTTPNTVTGSEASPFTSWPNGKPKGKITVQMAVDMKNAALQGQSVLGSQPNASASNYIAMLGQERYQKFLNASYKYWVFQRSTGNEINNGIDLITKQAVRLKDPVPPGRLIMYYKDSITGVVDYSNGLKLEDDLCINVTGLPYVAPTPSIGNQALGNNQQVVVNNIAKEISYAEGEAIRRAGADERELAFTHGAMFAKGLMNSNPAPANQTNFVGTQAGYVMPAYNYQQFPVYANTGCYQRDYYRQGYDYYDPPSYGYGYGYGQPSVSLSFGLDFSRTQVIQEAQNGGYNQPRGYNYTKPNPEGANPRGTVVTPRRYNESQLSSINPVRNSYSRRTASSTTRYD